MKQQQQVRRQGHVVNRPKNANYWTVQPDGADYLIRLYAADMRQPGQPEATQRIEFAAAQRGGLRVATDVELLLPSEESP